MEITTFRLSGQREARRFVDDFAPEALRQVRRCKSGSMPRTRLVLTTTDGLQQLGIESMAKAADVPRRMWSNGGPLYGAGGLLYACTVLAPHGADILIAVREAEKLAGLAGVLLHEPVHAIQFGPGSARRDEIRRLRHSFGVEELPARELRRAERRMHADEREAQRIERRLLARI